MPKQILEINPFHGGLNNNGDPRDIKVEELSQAQDIMIDEIGKVRTMGSNVAHDAGANVAAINDGYGLFHFSHDRKGAHVINDDLSGTHTASDSSTVMTDSAATFPVDGLIGATINNTTDGSSGVITDNTATTVTVSSLTGGSDNSWDDSANDAYTITDFPETGDDYLVMADTDGEADIDIYSRSNDNWGNAVIDLGSTTGTKPCFYNVDGALRVSDGNFGAENTNKWYGYINRTLFSNVNPSYNINQWYEQVQAINPPSSSYFDDDADINASIGSNSHTDTGSTTYLESARTDLSSMANIIQATVDWKYTVNSPRSVAVIITCGVYEGSSFTSTKHITTVASGYKTVGTYTGQEVFTFIASDTVTGTGGPHGSWDDFRSELTTTTGTSSPQLTSMLLNESAAMPDLNDARELTNDNSYIQFHWENNTGATGWNNASDEGAWQVGMSFIYDGSQESQITTLTDTSDGTTTTLNVPTGTDATAAPVMRIFIADFVTISPEWNKRITGLNIYMRDVGQDTTKPWFLQLSGDFETGKMKVETTQIEYDATFFNEANLPYYYWFLAVDGTGDVTTNDSVMLTPSNVISYETNTGLKEDEKSIISMYKSAVVVNRKAYIGGLQVEYKDGTKEIKGDAMIKSPVNQFDIFPLSRIIEATIMDGDEIVELEEYADRILQFKKNKMQLINVSQELEFLEDTFMHKGVSVPSATCKTDYGIAWVNENGCYLYDGQRVNDLLEKGGMQIIKESEWSSFIGDTPMIGYLPKKRQIIVATSAGTGADNGNIYLYDLVTKAGYKVIQS